MFIEDDTQTEEAALAALDAIGGEEEVDDENGTYQHVEDDDTSDDEGSDDVDADDDEGSDDVDADDEESSDDDEPSDDESDDDEGEDDSDDPDLSSLVELTDDQEFRVGEETFKVGDLRELQKRQSEIDSYNESVSQAKRHIQGQAMFLAQQLDAQMKSAQAEHDKYKNVDLIRASRELDDEDFNSLREAKEAAEARYNTLNTEAQEFVNNTRQARNNMLREEAKQARQILSRDIEGWNDQLYNDIRSYGVSQGIDAQVVNEIVDPAIIKIINKARLADKVKEGSSTKVKQKLAKAPVRAQKRATKTSNNKDSKLNALRKQAAENGDMDAITALLDAQSE